MTTATPRVLMLGWEYPPRYVGGLGKASQGIARGVAGFGLDVLFVLPQFSGNDTRPHLRVAGASQWLADAAPDMPADHHLTRLALDVPLTPYARPPSFVTESATIGKVSPPRTAITPTATLYGSDLGLNVLRFARQVDAIADRMPVDLVHAHDWMTFPAALTVAQHHHLPLFLHVHSTEYDRAGDGANPHIADIERRACRAATRVFAVSDYTRHMLIDRYGIDPDKVDIVYNAPDGPLPPLPPDSFGQRKPWIVFLGRLAWQKGPDHFLRAAERVARFDKSARFLVCGSGGMLDALKRQVDDAGIADRVAFRGFLGPDAVNAVLAQSRLLVMPSVSEPFGLVPLEALRMGTPVILSRQSGIREVLGHSLQVDFWDHRKLADQIMAVLRFPALGEQLVEEGRAQLAHLSWQLSARRIVKAYRHAGIDTERR